MNTPTSLFRSSVVTTLALAALALSPVAAADSTVVIDFERFPGPDGLLGSWDDQPAPPCPSNICMRLTSEYASMGLVFTSGTLGSGALFPGTTPGNHFVTSSPLDVTVLGPGLVKISIRSYSVWPATLYALDAANNVLASDTTNNVGNTFQLATLQVSSPVAIARFTVLPTTCSIGAPCQQILNVDDLTLTFALGPEAQTPSASNAPSIPALSHGGTISLALLLALIGGMAATRIRR